MWPDRVSNQGPLTYDSGALPTALRGPASFLVKVRWECIQRHRAAVSVSTLRNDVKRSV